MSRAQRPLTRDGFEIAIIYTLPVERDAVEALLDEEYEDQVWSYGKAAGDINTYTLGRLGGHHVVLVYMPNMGITSAAAVACCLRSSFLGLKLGILAGVCGGAPTTRNGEDIFLGDIVVSTSLVQIDFGAQYPHKFVRKEEVENSLGRANPEIRAYLNKISSSVVIRRLKNKISITIASMTSRMVFAASTYPGSGYDVLYPSNYRHKHQHGKCHICNQCQDDSGNTAVCEPVITTDCQILGCKGLASHDRRRLRKALDITDGQISTSEMQAAQQPAIHFGRVASSNQVLKSAFRRDQLVAEEQIIGFEMEGAGFWEYVPTIVVKGVCDYADSHKNKRWQRYAALAAAACTKAILEEWRMGDKQGYHLNFDSNAASTSTANSIHRDIQGIILDLQSISRVKTMLKHYEDFQSDLQHIFFKVKAINASLLQLQTVVPSPIPMLHIDVLRLNASMIKDDIDDFLLSIKKRHKPSHGVSTRSDLKKGLRPKLDSSHIRECVMDFCESVNGRLTCILLLISSSFHQTSNGANSCTNELSSLILQLSRRMDTLVAPQAIAIQSAAEDLFRVQLGTWSLRVRASELDASAQQSMLWFGKLRIEIDISLRSLFLCLMAYFRALLLMLPHLLALSTAFRRILRRLPPTIGFMLSDNIRLEDALGRVHSLQFQAFKHWPTFEQHLKYIFSDTPGGQKVDAGRFVLFTSTDVLSPDNWGTVVKAGTHITMSIRMTALFFYGQCPRGCIAGTLIDLSGAEYCSKCDLIFTVFNPSEADSYNVFSRKSEFHSNRIEELDGAHGTKEFLANSKDSSDPHSTPVASESVSESQLDDSKSRTMADVETASQLSKQRMTEADMLHIENEELKYFKRVFLERGDDTNHEIQEVESESHYLSDRTNTSHESERDSQEQNVLTPLNPEVEISEGPRKSTSVPTAGSGGRGDKGGNDGI